MISRKVLNRLRLYRERGLIRSIRIAIDTAALSILRLFFGFDPWHSRTPSSLRTYRKELAAFVSSMHPQRVVEVGCGLGGILSRVNAVDCTGYDCDGGAIRAARFLHRRSAVFKKGSFDELVENNIDVLIAVNWLHDFPPSQIEKWMIPLLPRIRFLLLDRVNVSSPLAFEYYHNFSFLEGRAILSSIEAFGEKHRQFLLYRVTS